MTGFSKNSSFTKTATQEAAERQVIAEAKRAEIVAGKTADNHRTRQLIEQALPMVNSDDESTRQIAYNLLVEAIENLG